MGCPIDKVIGAVIGEDAGDDASPERLFVVTDLPSATLSHRMAETKLPYSERQILQMWVTIAETLAFLHRAGEALLFFLLKAQLGEFLVE